MTTEASLYSPALPTLTTLSREAIWWLTARAAEPHETYLTFEVEGGYWRLRCFSGEAISTFEARLLGPLSVGDLAAAVARWAQNTGLVARSTHDNGKLRMSFSHPTD
jgi:hypothetical protein